MSPRHAALRIVAIATWLLPCTAVARQAATGHQESVCARLLARAEEDPRLELSRVEHEASRTVFVQGHFTVPENRATGAGRQIRLRLTVLPARRDDAAPDPVFVLRGGPGAAATSLFGQQVDGWIRERRDVVLIDQRGTGGSNGLHVPMPGKDDDLQGYLGSYFLPRVFEAALPALERRADLHQYTTESSVDDFDEVRAALGYGAINLRGGSYGTRAALVYMRRHPETIRSASLQAIQPISYRNPLPHARGAQDALDLIFEEIRSSPRYRAAFPDAEKRFEETLKRLVDAPATVKVRHPTTGAEHTVVLDRDAFAEAVRLQLYSLEANRRLPLLLARAHGGDYRELTEAAIARRRAVRDVIAWGMLMCVTGSEDIPRIDPAEVEPACAGTFLGTVRVRSQLAVAAIWPSGAVSEDFSAPVKVDVPVLLLSGTHDPSTAPRWGAEAASHLPNSLHVVVPGGHGVSGGAVRRLEQAFLELGSVEGLDLSEIERLQVPPLVLPAGDEAR